MATVFSSDEESRLNLAPSGFDGQFSTAILPTTDYHWATLRFSIQESLLIGVFWLPVRQSTCKPYITAFVYFCSP